MAFIIALLCLAAVIWIVRKWRGASDPSSGTVEQAFESGDLFETAPIGYMVIDREGIVRRVNRLECKLRGVAESAMLGAHCADLIPKIDREKYREQIRRRIEGHTALVTYQREYAHDDGSKVSVEVHEQLLRNKEGQVRGMRLASIDVTDLKRSEDTAFETAKELQALFQGFPDLFLRINKNDTVLDAKGGQRSDSFLRTDKFQGKNLQDLLPAGVLSQVCAALEKVHKGNSMEMVEFSIQDRLGSQSYEMRLLPLHWE